MLALRHAATDDSSSEVPTALELRVIRRKLDERLASLQRNVPGSAEILIGEFRAIAVAKQRLRDGTYGSCPRCGAPIGVARLLLDPAVARCARCESASAR